MKHIFIAIALAISLASVQTVEAQLVLRSSKLVVRSTVAFSSLPGILTLVCTHSPVASLSLGSLATITGYWWAYHNTAEYKLDKALWDLAEIKNTREYRIAELHQHGSSKTMNTAVEKYYVDFKAPLVSCFDEYSKMRSKITAAQTLCESVYTELKDSTHDTKALELAQDAENCLIDLLEAQENVEAAMLALKKDPSWHKSVKAKYSKDTAEAADRAATAAQINAIANTINAFKHKS